MAEEYDRRQFIGNVGGYLQVTLRVAMSRARLRDRIDALGDIEKYPLHQVAEGYEQMHSGRVRFRVVLTMA